MKTNTSINRVIETTYEGTPAKCINAEQQLRRSVLACMLWESSFYEDGVDIAKRIADCVKNVDPQKVSELAIETRTKMKLRHAPLWIVREMARLPKHKAFVSYTLQNVIQRADELSEFVSLYWSEKRQPLSAQVKKGLAEAFRKFDGYALAKYNSRDANVKLRDVLFLCHANPKNKEQENLWKQLIDNKLPIPNTWENRLSSGEDKKTVWESMLKENELGALALLRNLRNMAQVGVDENIVFYALSRMKVDSVLPFRFISAAKAVPQWESEIEKVMLKCLDGKEKLGGKTVILIDVSYSMHSPISEKSDLMRYDVANGLAILARELCDKVAIYTFSDNIVRIPDRHGFALRDAIVSSQPHVGTYLGHAIDFISKEYNYDRIIVITDEQS
ncbi:MAG: TROVE domain-containing protein, partial [Spirochaetes bacterium]|nr:TROVE domain-containing protein [Spirochaetota bacterium]